MIYNSRVHRIEQCRRDDYVMYKNHFLNTRTVRTKNAHRTPHAASASAAAVVFALAPFAPLAAGPVHKKVFLNHTFAF